MDTDIRALAAIAKTYCDAAYEMDADKFASIFHPSCSVTKAGEDGNVSVTPIEMWLAGVRSMKAPKLQDRRCTRSRALEVEIADPATLFH